MNDSRRRQPTLRASLLLAPALLALVSCGGGGGGAGTTSTTEARENANAAPSTPRTQGGNAGARAAVTEQAGEFEYVDPDVARHLPAAPFLCTRDPVAFDLSRLKPAGGVPQGFAKAWYFAQSRSELPGFVITYSGTVAGPVLKAQVGSVHKVAIGIYAFNKTLINSETTATGLDQLDMYHVRTENEGLFLTAFGDTHRREGFIVSDIVVEGRLDETCRTLHDVKVTMTLPLANREQRFGDVLLGTVLGSPNGRDRDGHDAWKIGLFGDYLDNMKFSL